MKTLEHILIQRKGLFPSSETAPGDGSKIARQLDIALMGSGYKLSHKLFDFLSKNAENHANKYACMIIEAIEEQLGDHVAHNSYFKAFPQGVPETHEFWVKTIVQRILTDDSEYGRYQHSYEEMLEAHREFKLEASEFSLIDLGQSPKDEFEALFIDLASSLIPLNEESRELLARLYREGYSAECAVPVRENQAILNALKIEAGLPVNFDTPVDALRVACQLSGGDVTLVEKTRFVSFKRSTRRALLKALDAVDTGKAPDLLSYVEAFKRLGERLHPREFKNTYRNAGYFFKIKASQAPRAKASGAGI
jgi:hypothetical protein